MCILKGLSYNIPNIPCIFSSLFLKIFHFSMVKNYQLFQMFNAHKSPPLSNPLFRHNIP